MGDLVCDGRAGGRCVCRLWSGSHRMPNADGAAAWWLRRHTRISEDGDAFCAGAR